jgi:hypothetical protein
VPPTAQAAPPGTVKVKQSGKRNMSLTNTAGFFKANQTTLPMINVAPDSAQASLNPRSKVPKFKDLVNLPASTFNTNYLNTPVSDHDTFRNAINHLSSDPNLNQDLARVFPATTASATASGSNTARGSSQQRKNRDLFKP